MRNLLRLVPSCRIALFLLVCCLPAASADAAILDMQGSLEFRLGPFPTFTLPQTQASLPIPVSTGGGGFAMPSGIFDGAVVSTPTGLNLITSLNLTLANLSGSFAPGGGHGGGFGGNQPLSGFFRIGILGQFTAPIPLHVVGATANTNLVVAQLSVTVVAKNFTTGPAIVSNISTTLTRLTPSDTAGCPPIVCGPGVGPLTSGGDPVIVHTVTLSGFDNRTPGHAGSVWLVSPAATYSNLSLVSPMFVIERFTFVPEPGTGVLLGSAAVAAAAWGARARRRRR